MIIGKHYIWVKVENGEEVVELIGGQLELERIIWGHIQRHIDSFPTEGVSVYDEIEKRGLEYKFYVQYMEDDPNRVIRKHITTSAIIHKLSMEEEAGGI